MKVLIIGTLLLVVAGMGCGRPVPVQTTFSKPSTKAAKAVTYRGKGIIKEVQLEKSRAVIAHEAIPAYMQAMTMPFDVRNPAELQGLKAGDSVEFRLNVTDTDGWIDQVRKINTTNDLPNIAENHPSFRRVRDVDPLQVGDVMPDYHFTNELGQGVDLTNYLAQAYVMTFIFTRCPFPTFCPRMSSQFSDLASRLKQQSLTNWHLFSITFDPEFDTPATLHQYASRYKYDASRWNFLSGSLIDTDAITEQFGLAVAWRGATIDHTLRTVLVDASGKIKQILIGNEWKVEDLLPEVIRAMR